MCTYARISLARSPSSDRTSFTRRIPPSVPPRAPPCPLRVPHRSFAPLIPTRDARSRRSHDPTISLPTALALARAIPLSPTACLRSSFALFFPSCLLFFSSSTPPGRRVIFIICYLLRHTPPAVAAAVAANRRVSGAAHPEKPENRGKQKRPARRAAHPAGWARSNGSGGNG